MDWPHLYLALAALGCVLASGRLAPAREGDAAPGPPAAVDGIPRPYAGTVRVESDDRGRILGYLLEVPARPGDARPPALYKLVTAAPAHAPRLGALEGKKAIVFGPVGRRADGLYLWVEDLTGKDP